MIRRSEEMNQTLETLVILEVNDGDLLTPIAIYQKLSGKKKFLFESSLKHEDAGRFSFIGCNPVLEVQGSARTTVILSENEREEVKNKPLEVVKEQMKKIGVHNSQQFPFIGGAVGFAGYDVIRQYEEIGVEIQDDLQIPEVHFMFFEEVIVFDHLKQKLFLVGVPIVSNKRQLEEKLSKRKAELFSMEQKTGEKARISQYRPLMSEDAFISKVEKAKEYIKAGDIFQVVLSQRLQAEISGDPFDFYRKLRIDNPSPYMYYLDFGDYKVAGASPESLVKVNQHKVMTNPIAGTRPRGRSNLEDDLLAKELKQDEKEVAEHRMLLDLGRNDLGRVCEFGTISIRKYMNIEKYKHVMHLVSEVEGQLKNECTNIDALISCLPAGTVSGAPKIRAMEIINELEETKRGIYSGAIGYLSTNGNMDFALAIRTMVAKDGNAYIQAGAGIVYDSIPKKEYEETIHKLKAFLEANK
ncbi:anthranilate synthase component I [Cytobacillus sp. FSL R7-0696]|uniref:anthranilate synthase component I n=1 Tax=Cytobacillus sp. FSL R7-0696 TaxID=2921691 RepID=UPI0040468B0A